MSEQLVLVLVFVLCNWVSLFILMITGKIYLGHVDLEGLIIFTLISVGGPVSVASAVVIFLTYGLPNIACKSKDKVIF